MEGRLSPLFLLIFCLCIGPLSISISVPRGQGPLPQTKITLTSWL
jgi:hypothetical protein